MKENDKEKIDASVASKESKIYASKKLSKWFSVYFRIQVFGVTIFEFTFPPQENE